MNSTNFSALPKRLVTSLVLISLSAFVLFRMSAYYFGALVVLFVAAALFEFFTLLRETKMPSFRLFGVVMGVVVSMSVVLESGAIQSGDILFLVLGCLFLFIIQFFRHNNSEALVGISLTLFGILYVSWFLSFVIRIRFIPNGIFWVAFLLAVTKSADIGAYFVGTLFGRHPLIPHISPKKSVEGTLGGVVLSVVTALALKSYIPVAMSTAHVAAIGFLIGIVGQVGDLSESLMKRSCNAKDSSSLLPGMGGVLDAVDSILFTAPIFYLHLKIFLQL